MSVRSNRVGPRELGEEAAARSMWPWSGDRYCLSGYRLHRGGALTLRGFGVPSRIYRAISSTTVNDDRLAIVNTVIVTVPTYDVALVLHVAPMGISGLEGMACSGVKA